MVSCKVSEILVETEHNSHQNEKYINIVIKSNFLKNLFLKLREYLRIENYDPRNFTELLIPEIITLLQLKHENIIKYYDYDYDDNFSIILEIELLKDSDTLALHIKKSIKRDLLIKWFKQLVSSLKYLHSYNVFHRDLKPRYKKHFFFFVSF
jgi:serine/threonine protein kinase